MIDELKKRIKDYYGSAMQIYPAAMIDLEKIERGISFTRIFIDLI